MELKDIIGICALAVSSAAIYFSYRTSKRQRETASAALLTTLTTAFDSQESRQKRRAFAQKLQFSPNPETIDIFYLDTVLDLFEEIGYLVKRGILDKGMVMNHFYWYLERYHRAVTQPVDLITIAREKYAAPGLYQEFVWMVGELKKVREKECGGSYGMIDDAAVERFLLNEIQLVPPPEIKTL